MTIDISKYSTIATHTTENGIKHEIAQYYRNDVGYITLSKGVHSNWWVYNGSILKANYMVVFQAGKYHFIEADADLRYGNTLKFIEPNNLDHSSVLNNHLD